MGDLILSEVHVEVPHASAGSSLTCTRFSFPFTSSTYDSSDDDDGDVAVRRQQRAHFTIHHQLATTLQHVGQQVWNGACFFADLFLHDPSLVADKVVLDLGGGVGLASIAAALTAKAVFCTDIDTPALELAVSNAHANISHYQHGPDVVQPRYLDVFDQSTWPASITHTTATTTKHREPLSAPSSGCASTYSKFARTSPTQNKKPEATEVANPAAAPAAASDQQLNPSGNRPQIPEQFRWTTGDLCTLQDLDLIFAADLVYDDDLTEAFVSSTIAFMAKYAAAGVHSPVLLVGIEKRFNFTVRDMEVRAPAYDHFLACLMEQLASCEARGLSCSVQLLDAASIPQAIAEYDRSGDMELWRVQLQQP